MRVLVALLLLSLTGCNNSGPLFDGITRVETRTLELNGLKKRSFDPITTEEIADCLTKGTIPLASEDELTPPLLSHSILLEVTDKRGSKSFELLTKIDLKTKIGTEVAYFQNRCIHSIIIRKPPKKKKGRR